jgi:hypothetical protein
MAVLDSFFMVRNRCYSRDFRANSLHFEAYFTFYGVKRRILITFGEKELQMSKLADLFKITSFKVVKADDDHEVELSHNHDKTEWYVSVEKEFYTEFTFDTYDSAYKVFDTLVNCKNFYMDTKTEKMSDAEVLAYEEGN